MTCSVSQKVDTELVQAPTSQAISRDTDHLRPSNLSARTVSLVEHTLSKFGGDPCLCAKNTFFLVWAGNRNDPSLPTALLTGFSTMKENPVCFLFSGTIIVGLMQSDFATSDGIKSDSRIRRPKSSDFGPKSDDSTHRLIKSKNGIGL